MNYSKASNFKLWLENDFETNFNNWHQEYLDAQRRIKYPAIRSQDMMSVHNNFKNDARIKNNSIAAVEIIDISGNSSGVRGMSYDDERAAGDPAADATWEILINGATEQLLKGRPAIVIDKSGGSYHERWLRLSVYVIVNSIVYQDDYDDSLDYQIITPDYFPKIVRSFTFQSLQEASKIIEEIQPNISYPHKDNETSDDYWKRIIASKPKPELGTYDSSDNYWKKHS